MRYAISRATAIAAMAVSVWPGTVVAETDPSAYIERWATGTLTTGEPFESWRIHVVVPDGDDWVASDIDGWVSGGPTWYYNYTAGIAPPHPNLFGSHPDAEFTTFWTSPHLHPNSDLFEPGLSMTGDSVHEPTYVHLGGWSDTTVDTNGDYVVWQGTVINPVDDVYGNIEFAYATVPGPFFEECTFVIPEPATAALLALGALGLRRRRLIR